MNQLKKGAILNYITIILTNVGGLLLTPFIISKLGDSEYGVYLTIGALIGSISILDFGLNNTIIRFVAKYQAEKNEEAQQNFLGTVMVIYIFISLLVLIIGSVFYFNIENYFNKMTVDEMVIAKKMFIILIFNLVVRLPGGAYTGICSGYEQFVFPKKINIIRYIFRIILVISILILGGRAISIVIIDTVLNLLIILVTIVYVRKKLKVKFKLLNFDWPFIKEILSYSVWIFIFAIVGMFQWKAGQIVLGSVATSKSLAIYGLGVMLGTYYGAFSTAISSVFLPKAMKMSVNNASSEELTSMMIKIGRVSFIILMYILIAFAFFGEQFVNLWVGKSIGEESSRLVWIIALMIMLAYTLPLIQGFGNSILEARNKLSFKAILYLSFMIIGVLIGVYLAKEYGALGMISGTVFSWIIVQNVMNFYYYKVIHLNILRFFKELFNKIFFPILGIIIFSYFLNFIPGNNWISFIIRVTVYSIVFSLLMYYFGMLKYEKQLISKILPDRKK